MFSVTYTGMNFFPLCTASMWPTNSGITVERRDQVLMTFFSDPRFITSIFSSSEVSTKGPFFSERLISASPELLIANCESLIADDDQVCLSFNQQLAIGIQQSLLLLSPLDDELVGRLAIARLVALGRLTPRRYGMAAARGLAFTAAERVVDRVHRDATHVRPLAKPAAAAGLADRHVLVIEVADLPDRGVALDENLAHFARRHLHGGVVAFLGHQLHRRSGAARDLAALARLQLHVVDQRAERNALQRQRVARQDVDRGTGHDRVAHLQADRMQDVALLAVGVGQQRNARRAVRVVLDRRHLRGHAVLVALEVDDAVHPLVAAAAPPRGELATVVAAARPVQLLDQRLVRLGGRDLVEGLDGLEALTGRRRIELANRHGAESWQLVNL